MQRLNRTFFPSWLAYPEDSGGVVLSTRIRLARNFRDLRFPGRAPKAELEQSLARVQRFTSNLNRGRWRFDRLDALSALERGLLAERGLINMESFREPGLGGLASQPAQTVSLLVNEEDHVRLQVLLPGFDLAGGLRLARDVDDTLNRELPVAVDARFGFLTACPTNVGTGLRASVMLHLPALALSRGIAQVLQAVLHMGLAVRGFYGEGTEFRSVFFQISNQVTLGRTEDEVITQLQGVVRQIIERELEARQNLVKEHRVLLEDKIGRALGVLSGVRLLGFEEALDLVSAVWLGAETGLAGPVPKRVLSELLLLMQTAHLQWIHGGELSAEAQQRRRAELIRGRLKLTACATRRKGKPSAPARRR